MLSPSCRSCLARRLSLRRSSRAGPPAPVSCSIRRSPTGQGMAGLRRAQGGLRRAQGGLRAGQAAQAGSGEPGPGSGGLGGVGPRARLRRDPGPASHRLSRRSTPVAFRSFPFYCSRSLDGHVIVEFRSVATAAGPCEIASRRGGPEPRPPIHQSAAGGKHEQEVGHLVGRLSVPGSRAFAGFRRGRQGAGRGRAGGRTRGRAVGRSSGCRAGRKVQGGACAGRAGQGGQAAPGRAAAAREPDGGVRGRDRPVRRRVAARLPRAVGL